jgi:hypothetical protein
MINPFETEQEELLALASGVMVENQVADNLLNVARVQAQGKNSGPASKARYFVLSAFAHERRILIGCLLLDSIIRSVIHHKGFR